MGMLLFSGRQVKSLTNQLPFVVTMTEAAESHGYTGKGHRLQRMLGSTTEMITFAAPTFTFGNDIYKRRYAGGMTNFAIDSNQGGIHWGASSSTTTANARQ
ncbi:hypothetical protein G6O67_004447 [Ophiocordyceps sinensis]|uniref:Uncharacterized protein n=1 Tax=Ophiocordyceps sinensis TaxID=72228 RepID=A0A8H4LYW8_9HYPO|nr:hypothetical protein G6O67_004447 [Ophiocordyceps sinensis]